MTTINTTNPSPQALTLDKWLHHVIAVHFDPKGGTPFWLNRAADLGIDPLRDVDGIEDLVLFGQMTDEDLQQRPLTDYIPKQFHHRLDRFILGQTGGTTGHGTWTAYRNDEFDEAFVLPFVEAATHVGFPHNEQWLYIGPSGPHIIGKVVKHLAIALGSPDPFSVDFDPRWVKRLTDGSIARQRYTQHVIDQAMRVIDSQPIGVLFTTPVVLQSLAQTMTNHQRARIRGVHYGGMAVSTQQIDQFQKESFPNAIHLSGYGNTLFGCCLELNTQAGRPMDYFPYGNRLILECINDLGNPLPPGERGQVRFTRLDESMLIVRMIERDQATLIEPPSDAPDRFASCGVRNPEPPSASLTAAPTVGLY